jgi:hypothetical protein
MVSLTLPIYWLGEGCLFDRQILCLTGTKWSGRLMDAAGRDATGNLVYAGQRRHYPRNLTSRPAARNSAMCQLPTSGKPPLTTTVEPSQSWSLSDGSCPISAVGNTREKLTADCGDWPQRKKQKVRV